MHGDSQDARTTGAVASIRQARETILLASATPGPCDNSTRHEISNPVQTYVCVTCGRQNKFPVALDYRVFRSVYQTADTYNYRQWLEQA